MGVGPLRGTGGAIPPQIKSVEEKAPRDPGKVLEKAVEGVLKPGQHLVMPARTGLAHFKDHFDARAAPAYDKLLKGEARTAEKSEASASTSESRDADDAQATAFAQADALALMDLLPPTMIAQAPQLARARDVEEAEDAQDEERPRHHAGEDDEPERTDPGDGNARLDADFDGPEAPALEHRALELQAGLFTLDEGSVDVGSRRLCTLEAYLDGDVPYVSVAVDLAAIPEGARLRMPALDAAAGRPVPLRAVHQNDRTEGTGVAYLEVCVSDADAWRVLEAIVTVEVG